MAGNTDYVVGFIQYITCCFIVICLVRNINKTTFIRAYPAAKLRSEILINSLSISLDVVTLNIVKHH